MGLISVCTQNLGRSIDPFSGDGAFHKGRKVQHKEWSKKFLVLCVQVKELDHIGRFARAHPWESTGI